MTDEEREALKVHIRNRQAVTNTLADVDAEIAKTRGDLEAAQAAAAPHLEALEHKRAELMAVLASIDAAQSQLSAVAPAPVTAEPTEHPAHRGAQRHGKS